MSEHDLLALFIREAPKALTDLRVFRRNIINRVVMIEGRKVHLVNGIPGQGDAYALLRGGRHVEIETKSAKGAMREAQERWRDFCAAWGVPHLVLKAREGEAEGATVARWIEELRVVTHDSGGVL
jgi:hypothetical protein